MKMLLIAASAAAITMTTPLFAQSQHEPFQGPYVGAQIGYDHDSYGAVDSRFGRVGIDDNRDSFTGGAFAGYDYHLTNKIVVGGEGDFDLGANDSRSVRRGNTTASIDPRHAFSVSARAGYQVDPKTLLYVRGGYENVDARVSLVNANVTGRDTRTYDGWLAGAGVERYLTDNVSARVEYRYSDLGGGDTHFHRQQGLFGVSYHF
jgi:outer membrane immunogenic protein